MMSYVICVNIILIKLTVVHIGKGDKKELIWLLIVGFYIIPTIFIMLLIKILQDSERFKSDKQIIIGILLFVLIIFYLLPFIPIGVM